MADSTTNLAQIEASQAQKEVTANGLFDAASPATFGGRRVEACTGLVWGYYGGRWGGVTVANGTLTLVDSDTNYLVMDRLTGEIILDTPSDDLWADTDNYAHLYEIVAGTSSVTSFEDHRAGPSGAIGSGINRNLVSVLTSTSGVVDIDCGSSDYFTLALTEAVTSITFSGLSSGGRSLMIHITQDSTARTVAWPASFKWAGGSASAVSTVSGDEDILAITTFDGGTAWNATLAKAFA